MKTKTLSLLVLLAALGGCDAFYSVRGTVASCRTGAPLAGAAVDLKYPGEHGRGQTEPDGKFQVSANDPPNTQPATLTVVAPGYRTDKRAVHDGDQVDICLEETPSKP